MLDKFIGIDGRINRKKYIFRSLLLWGMGCIFELCVIMSRVEQLDFIAGDLPGMVLLTIVGIPWMMLMVRRLHDLNRNGFWSLLVFVPVASFFLFLYLCCFRGTRGRNSYGEDPLGRKADT